MFSVFGNGSPGFTKINGLTTGVGPYPILLQGPGITTGDIAQVVPRFDKRPLIYSFGKEAGNLNLSGLILLGPSGSPASGAAQLKAFFESRRLSNSNNFTIISAPGGAIYRVALTNLTMSSVDPTFHIMDFILRGYIVE